MFNFHISIPTSYIVEQLNTTLDEITKNEKFESHGFIFKLIRRGDVYVNVDGFVIFSNLIADIQIFKEGGLFSTEVTGVIDLSFATSYNVNEHFEMKTKSDLVGHKWVEKPKIEIGSLQVPLETVVSLLLKHYESIITGHLDQALKNNLKLRTFVENTLTQAQSLVSKPFLDKVYVDSSIEDLYLQAPSYHKDTINLIGAVNLSLGTSPNPPASTLRIPNLIWTTKVNPRNVNIVKAEVPYDVFYPYIIEVINKQVIGGKSIIITGMSIASSSDKLVVTLHMKEPVPSTITLHTKTQYIEEKQLLELIDPQIDLDTNSFIYKLSAPLVSRFAEGMIAKNSPVDIGGIIQKYLPQALEEQSIPLGTIHPNVSKVAVEKLQFAPSNLILSIKIIDAELKMEVV